MRHDHPLTPDHKHITLPLKKPIQHNAHTPAYDYTSPSRSHTHTTTCSQQLIALTVSREPQLIRPMWSAQSSYSRLPSHSGHPHTATSLTKQHTHTHTHTHTHHTYTHSLSLAFLHTHINTHLVTHSYMHIHTHSFCHI